MTKSSAEEAWWWEATKTVGLSLLLAFGIRSYVAEARYIPSGSMEPTLQINDRLIIEKINYYFNKPERGDIVVFNPTEALKAQGYRDAFIKRVIGVPGDQVEILNGGVYVNQQRIEEGYVDQSDITSIDTCALEGTQPFLNGPQVIPDDRYLVLGDNRDNSYDGRCWGLVAKEDILGRAVFRFWPPNRVGTLPEADISFSN